jgi:molybdopterin converting factor small subunit
VRVTVHAEDLLPDRSSPILVVDDPCTVGEAARLLPLTRSTGLMILVNGKLAQWDTALRDGDEVELVPALGGG